MHVCLTAKFSLLMHPPPTSTYKVTYFFSALSVFYLIFIYLFIVLEKSLHISYCYGSMLQLHLDRKSVV